MKKIHGRKYNLISGILVRHDTEYEPYSLEFQKKKLYKRLKKCKSKLIKAETVQSMSVSTGQEPFRNAENGEMKSSMKRNCLLIDERDPLNPKTT